MPPHDYAVRTGQITDWRPAHVGKSVARRDRRLAVPAARLLAGHPRHAPQVDPARRQDPPRAGLSREPLVAHRLLPDASRAHHLADALRLRTLSADFDFLDHRLHLRTSEGATRSVPLVPGVWDR